MDSSKNRKLHFGKYASPNPGEVGYEKAMSSILAKIRNDPKARKKLDKQFKTVQSIGFTQSQNGVGLLQDQELRFFHQEFNDRTFQYGFGSLPGSFSILEGFFKWRQNLFYFELFDEEEHLFSFYDFYDFLTSDRCSNEVSKIQNNIDDDLIYSYNILNGVKQITFSTEDSKKYVLGGVSFIKRNNEVFMLLCAGEIGSEKEFKEEIPDFSSGQTSKPYLSPSEDREFEVVKLFGNKDIWKVNIYLRVDLETKTIDSRMVQKDLGNSFTTYTDDYGMLKHSTSDDSLFDEAKKRMEIEMNNYEPIFEVAYNCLFLPEYFNAYDHEIVPEEHPTSLVDKNLRKKASKDDPPFHHKYFKKYRDIWVLDRKIDHTNQKESFNKTELKLEKDGYWKVLEPGKIGIDKNGNEIHSRTWVEQTISWHESSAKENDKPSVKVNKSKNAMQGYIYLLRNAAHDLDLFKIGLTTKTVDIRAKQLSGTSSPDQFLIINKWFVDDCYTAEKLIHSELDSYRVNPKREFFKIDIETAINKISPIIKELNDSN